MAAANRSSCGPAVAASTSRNFDQLEQRTTNRHRPMTNDNTLIKLDSIKKVFYTDEVETHALSGIHLGIGKGEYISIAGPSGCGKSTLLSILGLLDSPTE